MYGNFSAPWVGVPSVRLVAPWNGMSERLPIGKKRAGHALKKSPERKANDSVCGRKRDDAKTAPCQDVGSQRTNPGSAIPFQLGQPGDHRRADAPEFLLSDV